MHCEMNKIKNMVENRNSNKTVKKLPKMTSFFVTNQTKKRYK